MSEEQLNTSRRVPLEWYEVWIRAVTKPSLATFEQILADYRASTSRAYTWIFATSLISQLITWVRNGLAKNSLYGGLDTWGGDDTTFWSLVCSPAGAGAAVLGFMVTVGILQWIAGRLGGRGEYKGLAIAMASYQAPLALLSAVVLLLSAWVPAVGWLALLVFLYLAVLHVMAVKAVNQLSWQRAAATILIPMGVLILVGCLATAVLGVTLGSLFEAGF